MRHLAAICFFCLLGMGSARAGVASYSNLVGNNFRFINMSENGGTNVPPGLEQPRLFTSPFDTIKFSPSTYVVVENNGPVLQKSTNFSTLNLTLDALAGAKIQELTVSISGTYGMTFYQSLPTSQANVGLSLGLDLTYGGTTVSNFQVNISQNSTDKTWSGIRTFTASELSTIFQQPSLQVEQLIIAANPSVSAEAQWANATSRISYLDFTVVPIPEPSSLSLVGPGLVIVFGRTLLRRAKKFPK